VFRHPAYGGHIVSGNGLAGFYPAEIIDQHVVVFEEARAIVHDALEDGHHPDRTNAEAGFLEHFAADGLLEGLAGFDSSAGKRPVAFQGLASTLDEKNFSLIDDECADA
jgi:hypothetical protein